MSDARDPDQPTPPPGDPSLRAAEYALGLLPPDDARAFESDLDVDGALRAELAGWNERLADIARDLPEVTPPPGLRGRLDAFARKEAGAAAAPARRRRGSGLRQVLLGALGGLALAAATVAVLSVTLPRVQPPGAVETYAADVATEDRGLVVLARYDTAESVLRITRESGETPEGRALQVWLLTEDQPPHAVGILPEEDTLTVDVSPFWSSRLPAGAFAVSVESPEGSTDEVGPTGEILATGDVAPL